MMIVVPAKAGTQGTEVWNPGPSEDAPVRFAIEGGFRLTNRRLTARGRYAILGLRSERSALNLAIPCEEEVMPMSSCLDCCGAAASLLTIG